jgi:DNA-directed RNA polymerase specialized sigma24 family protein
MTDEREDVDAGFAAFVDEVGPRVRRALVPVAGPEAARDATTDALVHAWRTWDRVRVMDNPAGYVWTVARSRLPKRLPATVALPDGLAAGDRFPDVEPGLAAALAALPERQRVAVYLQVGCRWPTPEVAALLGVSVSTVRNHTERGLTRLRRELGVTEEGS